MGKKDIAMRNFLRVHDICTDFVQNFIFKNHIVIEKNMIITQQTIQSVLLNSFNEHLFTKEKTRDLLLLIQENNALRCH